LKLWAQSGREVRKVKPDKELARSILKMVNVRMDALKLELERRDQFASLVVEDYYEIIKEILTALMAIDGYKTLSHEVLIGYLKEFYPEFSDAEIILADELRRLRNKISYGGFFITADFVERRISEIDALTQKLLGVLQKKAM
jgi:hypothetical protein